MIVTVEEGYTVQPAQYEAIRINSSVTVSHLDWGVSDEDLQNLSHEAYDDLAVKLRDLANALLWADLKPKLELASSACESENNLAAYILTTHPDIKLPTPKALPAPQQGEQKNGNISKAGNPQRPTGRRVPRRG